MSPIRSITAGAFAALVVLSGVSAQASDGGAPGPSELATGDPTTGESATDVQRTELQTIPLPTALDRAAEPPSPTGAPGDDPGRSDGGSVPIVYSERYHVSPFRLAAITWTGDAPQTAWIRTRSDGAWSPWYELPAGDDHQPDPATSESSTQRHGTDPLILPESDGIQVRVDHPVRPTAGRPTDLRLDLVDPEASPAPPESSAAVEPGAIEPAGVTRPAIFRRSQWGANESMRAESPTFGQVRGAFVHHTVSATAYQPEDVPAMIRSIYVYHVKSRGWNDIGYNFLIDRFGRIWEGRYGGINRAVIGAHTLGYNDDAFAASALGTYTNTPPTAAMLSAYQRLFAWKFKIHGVDPRYRVNYDGEGWQAVAGHRDAAATACPGDALYARIGTIHRGTTTIMGLSPSRDLRGDGRPDLLATRTDGTLWTAEFGRGGAVQGLRLISGGWAAMVSVAIPGDWNGDTRDDLIARRRSDGTLWLYPGMGNGTFSRAVRIGTGWQAMSLVTAPGDWNRDGYPDLIARRNSDGTLWLYPGNGTGGFHRPVRIGTGWQSFTSLIGPGDWDGDHVGDLIGRRSDGTLWLFPGRGGGRIGTARQIGTGWNGYLIAGAGDANSDGRIDLIARNTRATLVLYPGNGAGGFRRPVSLGTGWGGYNRLI